MIDTLGVLELTGSVAGGYAAKLLADHGASVTVAAIHPRTSAPWGQAMDLYLNTGKTRRTVHSPQDLVPLLADADIVIQSSSPDPLDSVFDRHQSLLPRDKRRIEVEISPFGSTGPWRDRRSTDLTDQALSGHLYLNGEQDRTPLRGPEHQVAYAAGTHAAIGALAAVRSRSVTGAGQRIEITHHEVMTALHQFTLMRWTHNGDILTRMGNRYAGPGNPAGMYRCGAGLISLIAPRGDQVETLLSIAGLDHLLDLPGVNNVYDLMHHPTLLDEHLAPWLADQDLEEAIELLQAVRVPAGSVSTMSDLLADVHLLDRRFWVTVADNPEQIVAPGPAAGTTRLDRAAPEPPPTAGRPAAPSSNGESSRSNADLAAGPLSGLRVLDLTRVWAGPYATRVLADLGADVIMIEAPWARGSSTVDDISVRATRYYPDNDPGEQHWNRIGFSNKYNINKRNLVLDLTRPEGLAVLETLIAQADILIENYSPRVMPQFGLDEGRLHELNSRLVYVTMPGFGRSGPSRDRVAYGPIIDSQAGLSVLMGYEGETARKSGIAWPDPVAGMHAAAATLAALVDREGDGGGRTVEVAQIESTIAVVGHAVIDRQLSGVEPRPSGNRHPEHAPHGVYRCQGRDRWLALSVIDDQGWVGLCRTAGFDPSWETWTLDQRRAGHDNIDAALNAWTATGRQLDLTAELQAVGVPAAPVNDAAQIMADPHHAARGFFVELDHPNAGAHRWPRLPIRLSDTPATYRRPGPNLNQDGPAILAELADLTSDAIAALYEVGATADRPPD